MRKYTRILITASVLIAGVAGVSALYAQDHHGSSGSMMGQGMMGRDGMMSEGGMMGMKGMTRGMSGMMDQCAAMMGEGSRPNDQWRGGAPATPEKK